MPQVSLGANGTNEIMPQSSVGANGDKSHYATIFRSSTGTNERRDGDMCFRIQCIRWSKWDE
eukprot:506807-Karenia_brevis.AAC.1